MTQTQQRFAGMETPTQQMRKHLARQTELKQTNTKCEQWPAWFKQCESAGIQTVDCRQPDGTITSSYHLCASHAIEFNQRHKGSR